MGFKADAVVAPLDFDFEPHVKGCKGVIPEPSDKQLRDFMKGVSNILKAITPKDVEAMSDPNAMLEALGSLLDANGAEAEAMNAEVHDLCAMVCSGTAVL